jgi:thiosulfate/3-mercaptopyruvate sulfurtransferase
VSNGAVRREPVLATAEWLRDHLTAPGLRIIDIRGAVLPPGNTPRYVGQPDKYAAGHIPGALYVDWTRDIVDVNDAIPVQIAPPSSFERTMRGLGISQDTLVVAYDDYRHIFAGRLAWALRYYGHDAVRVLDGGWSRWIADGGPVERTVDRPPPGDFVARRRAALRRTASDVEQSLGRFDTLIIDARPEDQYSGRSSAAARAGHIPGAVNIPYSSLVDPPTGTFLASAALARVFANAGVDTANMPSHVVVYCNGGVSCTTVLSALRILGRDNVAVYDGSWNEWGNDPARPIERDIPTSAASEESKRGNA